MQGKIIIISAPSGSGKSSIIHKLMEERKDLRLGFSISATSRKPRAGEEHGREYYFLSPEEFKERVEAGHFAEWEEVYEGAYYGTLLSEIERITSRGDTLIMDVDVKGGINLKKQFGDKALSIFIMPPSIAELESRLHKRATDSKEVIAKRVAKAGYELTFAKDFDCSVVNANLEKASAQVAALIEAFRPAE